MAALALLLSLLFIPTNVGEAATTASTTNTYVAAQEVRITDRLPADIVTAGARVLITAPVEGDVLAAAGTIEVAQGAGGDVRVLGGKVRIAGPVGGDIAAAGGTVSVRGSARAIYGAGASVDVQGSSQGSVTLYGASVVLGGDHGGNVTVIASDQLVLLPGTYIRGTLKYSAPEQLVLPDSVVIDGGVQYTGSYAYVPTNEQVHQYAIAGAGIFFLVRVLAGSILAGLLTGLFPDAVMRISRMVVTRDPAQILKLLLLGLFAGILGPVFILFLFVSLVGSALALFLSVLYALLLVLAYSATGIVLGYFLRVAVLSRLLNDPEFSWQDAIIGTITIHLVGFVPVFGTFFVFLLACICAGALLYTATRAVFPGLARSSVRDSLGEYDHHA